VICRSVVCFVAETVTEILLVVVVVAVAAAVAVAAVGVGVVVVVVVVVVVKPLSAIQQCHNVHFFACSTACMNAVTCCL